MQARHPQRLPCFDYIGPHRYSLRFCTYHHNPVFTDASRVDLVLQQFLRASAEVHVALIAYCFMPDHVHLLVEGTSEDTDLKKFFTRAKQYSGFYYAEQFGVRLWQRYGYEHILRTSDATIPLVRYIFENPVRARLVQRIEEYPYSDRGYIYSTN
jgi:putative transposase